MLFADDLLLHTCISCSSDFISLQRCQSDIDELCAWLNNNYSLTLNANKCKSLLISRKKQPTEAPAMFVNGHPLERVTSYKYLGILITSNLSWSSHIQVITTEARKLTGMLYRRFYKNSQPSTLKALYIVLIRPVLKYGIPAWDPYLKRTLIVLNPFKSLLLRFALNCGTLNPIEARLHSLKLDTLSRRRCHLKQCHLYKLVHG